MELIIVKADSVLGPSKIFEGFENQEIIKMQKIGSYFIAKPKKNSKKGAFYFKDGYKCFPTWNQNIFKEETLISNQCDGRLFTYDF